MRERDARYNRAHAIAHASLERAADDRAGYLDAQCGDDDALRRETEWLISAAGDTALDAVPAVIAVASKKLESDLCIDATAPGRYRLIERVGEGGMGVVWLAEREVGGARQRVALKRLHTGAVSRQARFAEEQRILASLNHPNIAHLVDAGVDAEGELFLAMEYVLGERIDHWCDDRELRARLLLFIKVCAAVSYAHEQLVIHGDLKPANILVTEEGDPKLLDFGIARLIDADASAHSTRAMTLAYASPEQIEGAPLGTATDIWSLGVVLYELVAGTHPFSHITPDLARASAILSSAITPPSQSSQHVTAQAAASAAVSAAAHARRIPADIDAIVMKALRRAPAQRYASVREFAQDVERFLAAHPVLARRGQWTYRAQRFVQRNRWPLAVTCVLVAVVIGFTWRTLLAEREARIQAEVAERTIEFLISAFSFSDPTHAERHDFSAREVLDRGRELMNEELAEQPRVRARLLEALGNAYGGISEGSAGAPLLEDAAQAYLDPAVNQPLAAARSLRAKSQSISAVSGSSVDAEHAAQRAFDLVQSHGGNDDLLLAEAWSALSEAQLINGGEGGVDAARKALALRETGQADPLLIAQGLAGMCLATMNSGDYRQALPYCERAIALHEEPGATRNKDYLSSLARLEIVLHYLGEYDRGMLVRKQSMALEREIFGADSSRVARGQVYLSGQLAERGLFDEAAAALNEGMATILMRDGASSSQYARALFFAGYLKHHTGEFDAAVRFLREAVETQDAAVEGRDRDRLRVWRVVLAQTLIESGRAEAEARALLETVIVRRGAMSPDVRQIEPWEAYAHLPLAQWHVANGEFAEADTLLDDVASIGNSVEPELHARAAATRAAIARARSNEAAALALDRSAYEITRGDRGADNPRTARYALVYARALRAAGDIDAAQKLEREYRAIVENAYPPNSVFRRLLTDR